MSTPDIAKIREALKMIDRMPAGMYSHSTQGMSLSEKAQANFDWAVIRELRDLVYDCEHQDTPDYDSRLLEAFFSTLDPSCTVSVSHPLGSVAFTLSQAPECILIDFAAWLVRIHDSIRCKHLLNGYPDRLYDLLRRSPHFRGMVELSGHDWMSFSPELFAGRSEFGGGRHEG